MHEFGIIQNIFTTIAKVAEENHLKKVTKVVLKVGDLRQVVPEFMEFAFNTLKKDTIASEAELVIEKVPIVKECPHCKFKITANDDTYFCPKCKTIKLELIAGKEIMIDNIEGE